MPGPQTSPGELVDEGNAGTGGACFPTSPGDPLRRPRLSDIGVGVDPFLIKQNDRLPYLEATLSDSGGQLTTLAGANVYFVMRSPKGGAAKVRGQATVVDAALKKVRYEWAAGDTDTAGVFRGEFEVNFSSRPWTFPNPGYIPIIIAADLG